MKAKTIMTAVIYVALASCLTMALAPCAFAASGTTFAAGKAVLATQAHVKKATSRPKTVSEVKAACESGKPACNGEQARKARANA